MELFIISSFSYYCSFLNILQNVKTAHSIKPSIYLFQLLFLSLSLLPVCNFRDSLPCSHKLKEFVAIFLALLEESFCTVLSRSHVFAQLFCFVITTATRNNIVKWYLHEKANAFLIYFRGVQGGGRQALSRSSLMHFSFLYPRCLETF